MLMMKLNELNREELFFFFLTTRTWRNFAGTTINEANYLLIWRLCSDWKSIGNCFQRKGEESQETAQQKEFWDINRIILFQPSGLTMNLHELN